MACLFDLQEESSYWQGFGRITELQIEGNFGELRTATQNCQLSAKSFCVQSAHRTVKALRRATGVHHPVGRGGEPMSKKQFLTKVGDVLG